MKRLIQLVLFILGPAAFAQAPANATLIGTDGITITGCSTPNCTYLYGANGKYNTTAALRFAPRLAAIRCTACSRASTRSRRPPPSR
jgi:hypothetical protein